MNLLLQRNNGTKSYTAGHLFIDGKWECCTLEDEVREIPGQPVASWKVYGRTAIPRGTYKVTITWSSAFRKKLPLLQDVPGYAGVRIHAGNTAENTEGCILVGQADGSPTDGWLGNSRKAMQQLQPKIQAALDAGEEVLLTIV